MTATQAQIFNIVYLLALFVLLVVLVIIGIRKARRDDKMLEVLIKSSYNTEQLVRVNQDAIKLLREVVIREHTP